MYAMVGPASSRLSPEWLAFERRHEENYAGRDRAHPYQNKKPHLAEGYTLSLILNSHTYVNRGPLGRTWATGGRRGPLPAALSVAFFSAGVYLRQEWWKESPNEKISVLGAGLDRPVARISERLCSAL